MIARLLILTLLCVPGLGQSWGVLLKNPAPVPQTRWTEFAVADEIADQLPARCWLDLEDGGRTIAYKGRAVGSLSVMFYARVELGAGELQHGKLTPTSDADPPGPWPAFTLSDWIGDDLAAVLPSFRGQPYRIRELVENHPVKKTWKLQAVADHGTGSFLWATVWSGQDVVDLCGTWYWRDWNDRSCRRSFESVELHCQEELYLECWRGEWLDPLGGHPGVPSAPAGWRPQDFPRAWRLFGSGIQLHQSDATYPGGAMPDAMSPGFYGALLPRPADLQQHDWQGKRERALQAAKHGPVCAGGDSSWQGHWGILGDYPNTTPQLMAEMRQSLVRFRRHHIEGRTYPSTDGSGYWWARHELYGYPFKSNQTGLVPHSGASKLGYAVLDPEHIYYAKIAQLQLRKKTLYHRESDGRLLDPAAHPSWRSKSGPTWYQSSDKLGKDLESISDGGGGSWDLGLGGLDQQHRSLLPVYLSYMLTGDWLLEDTLQAIHLLHHGESWQWYPTSNPPAWNVAAPRGARALVDLVYLDACGIADEAYLVSHYMRRYENSIPSVTGPVKALEIQPPGRGTGTTRSWHPWNHAVMTLGALFVRSWAQQHGQEDLQSRAESMMDYASELCLRHGLAVWSQAVPPFDLGLQVPCWAVRWNDDGQPNTGAYWQIPREFAYGRYDPSSRSSTCDLNYDLAGAAVQHYWYATIQWGLSPRSHVSARARELAQAVSDGWYTSTTNPESPPFPEGRDRIDQEDVAAVRAACWR